MKTALLLMALLACFSATAQTVKLSLQPELNKVYRFKSLSSQNVAQTVNGVQQNNATESNTVVSFKMIDSTQDFLIAEFHFDTLITKTNAMGKTVLMNSSLEGNMASSEAGDVLSCVLNRLSKNAVYAKIAYNGKVLDIVNIKMLHDIILKDTASITGQMAPMIKMQVKSLADDKALKTMIEMYTGNLPLKDVKEGDNWELATTIVSGGMSLDIITNYKLQDMETDVADISTEASIKASDNAAPLEFSGAKISYNGIAGLSKGEMEMDTITGLLKTSTSKTHIAGNLDLNMPGMSMQIPMEVNGETNVTALF